MDKIAAKQVAKSLKSRNLTHFGFATNGGSPALVVDKRLITVSTFKKRAASDCGVVYKSGPIAVGRLEREGAVLVFDVDPQASTGRIEPKKLVLGVRKLRAELTGFGATSPALAQVRVKVGDQVVSDEDLEGVDDYESPFGAFDAWEQQVNELGPLADAVRAARATPPDRQPLADLGVTEKAAMKRLRDEAHAVADDVKLAVSRASPADNQAHAERVAALKARVVGLLDVGDPSRAHGRAPLPPGVVHPPLPIPEAVPQGEKHLRPLMEALNAMLTDPTDDARTLDGLIAHAWALAQAARDRLRTLEGRFVQDKKKMKAMLEIQRLAEQAASALEARRATPALEVSELVTGGNTEDIGEGINHARFVTRGGKKEYVLKSVDPNHPDVDAKLKEFGSECGASSVGDLLSVALGLPRLVSPTFSLRLQNEGGNEEIGVVQDAWPKRAMLGDAMGCRFVVGEREIAVPEHLIFAVASLNGQPLIDGIRHYMPRLVDGWSNEEVAQLGALLKEDRPIERLIEIDPDQEAEDIAGIALVDLFTGQRDHGAGKTDNLLLVDEGGDLRVRPIDYGECMVGIDHVRTDYFDYGTWTTLPSARRPFPPELLARVLELDPDDLVGAARDGAHKAAIQSGSPQMELGDDQAELLRLQIEMTQAVARRAIERGMEVSPNLLGEAAVDVLGAVLFELKTTHRDGGDWRRRQKQLRSEWTARIDAFLDAR